MVPKRREGTKNSYFCGDIIFEWPLKEKYIMYKIRGLPWKGVYIDKRSTYTYGLYGKFVFFSALYMFHSNF